MAFLGAHPPSPSRDLNLALNGTSKKLTPEIAVLQGKGRHSGVINCTFLDGHARATAYDRLVDDACLWVTEVPWKFNGASDQWKARAATCQ